MTRLDADQLIVIDGNTIRVGDFEQETYERAYFEGIAKGKKMFRGWIKCSDRLPEQRDSVFAKFKDTPRWEDFMFEKVSNTVLVTIDINNSGKQYVTTGHLVDGRWVLATKLKSAEVIAWMPFPEPYTDDTEALAYTE